MCLLPSIDICVSKDNVELMKCVYYILPHPVDMCKC